jgi:hypothetical protein
MSAPWQAPDLDEFRANKFIIHNGKVRPFLRGEGEREGKFFHLQSWRREGLIARIRMAGFNVRTLQDRVDALHAIPPDVAPGPEIFRPITTQREQIAAWDPQRLRWRDLSVQTVNGVRGVMLRVNEPLRRRKSRAGGDYFIAFMEQGGGAGLRPVRERDAILQAYGLLAAEGRSAIIRFERKPQGYFVPADQALLPERHREALGLLVLDGEPDWTFEREHTDMVEQVFEKLGVQLEPFQET